MADRPCIVVPARCRRLPTTAPIVAALALVVVLAFAASASATLRLEPIPGPDGTVPFRSAGGAGPTFVTSPAGDTHRTFVLTQDGYVYVIVDGVTRPTPFLDLHTLTDTYNENGLFTLAFDPNYASTGRFWLDYSDLSAGAQSNEQRHMVVEYRRSEADPEVADPASARTLLAIPATGCADRSAANPNGTTSPHYGGQMAFGPDGDLWISVGDGGDGCGDSRRALRLDDLHGKLLRIAPDPDGPAPYYTIPPDNPLAGRAGVRQEIWGYGLRNPWRFSFDGSAITIGDVGDHLQEELDRLPATSAAGTAPHFFGWPCLEGTYVWEAHCSVLDTPVAPVLTYGHAQSGAATCSAIISGLVLHDPALDAADRGRYLWSYFCATGPGGRADGGRLYEGDPSGDPLVAGDTGVTVGFGASSFGTDGCGHAYIMKSAYGGGGLWRIEGATPGPCGEYRAPETSIGDGPQGVVASRDATLAYASSVRGSTYACTLDGAPLSCPASGSVQVTGLAYGTHTFTVAAQDEAGDADPTPATRTWTVDDGVAPDTSITAGPPSVVAGRSVSVSFASTKAESHFQCSLDYAPAQPCTSPATYGSLADGPHVVLVAAIDAAGRTDPTPAARSFVVDPGHPAGAGSGAGSGAASGGAAPVLPPVVGGTATGPLPPPPARLHAGLAAGGRVALARDGRLTVTLEPAGLPATAVLSVRSGRRVVARVHVTAAARRAVHVHLRLPAAVRALIARRGRLALRVAVELTARTGQRARAALVVTVSSR